MPPSGLKVCVCVHVCVYGVCVCVCVCVCVYVCVCVLRVSYIDMQWFFTIEPKCRMIIIMFECIVCVCVCVFLCDGCMDVCCTSVCVYSY